MANHRSVRYRLFPETGENVRALHGLAGACRYVWNHFLALHQGQYKQYREAQTLGIDGYRKPSVSFFNLGTQFTEFRAGHPWLEKYAANVVKYTLKHQSDAWRVFFNGGGYPKFREKHTSSPSFTIPRNAISISGNRINVPRIDRLRIRGNNPYPSGVPLQAVIKQEGPRRWYAYVTYEVPDEELIPVRPADNPAPVIGVDRRATGDLTCSSGDKARLPDLGRLEARRRRYQRRMMRQVKGSNRRDRNRQRMATLHRKQARIRQNWLHHAAKFIASLGELVAVENLDLKGRPAIGWGRLTQYLSYKARQVVQVKPAAASQACSACGCVNEHEQPSSARFECGACGHSINAELNAALNIARSGFAAARGTGASARGGAFLQLKTPIIREHDVRLVFG